MEIASYLFERITGAKRLTVLTGAGISAESGVPTFRDKDGLWRSYRPEELATPEAFDRDPELVWDWYRYRRGVLKDVVPNAAHRALVALERQVRDFHLITQNVDSLHQRAGSRAVIELHGNIQRSHCQRCGGRASIDQAAPVPHCVCGGLMRPSVIWFGESLPEMAINQAWAASQAADCFIVIGTSAKVQPAASLPLLAKKNGAVLIEINRETTSLSDRADLSLQGKAGELLPTFVAQIWPNAAVSL